MSTCKATMAPEFDKTGRGQDVPLKCDKDAGKHLVHTDDTAKANFVKVGRGGPVWPSR